MESQVSEGDTSETNTGDNSQNDDSPGTPWYTNAVFDRYWKQHNLAWAWYRHHCQLTETLSNKHMWGNMSQSPSGCTGTFVNQPGTSKKKGLSKNARRKKKRRMNQRKARLKSLSGEGESDSMECEEGDADEVVFEMEITPEMREFFETSAKHKQERDAEQRERELSEGLDYIDLTEVTIHTKRITAAAPTERPGAKRTEQMKLLYGKGAAMIHGMETALQLNFDRNFDLKTPKLWPHLPLNITFNS